MPAKLISFEEVPDCPFEQKEANNVFDGPDILHAGKSGIARELISIFLAPNLSNSILKSSTFL